MATRWRRDGFVDHGPLDLDASRVRRPRRIDAGRLGDIGAQLVNVEMLMAISHSGATSPQRSTTKDGRRLGRLPGRHHGDPMRCTATSPASPSRCGEARVGRAIKLHQRSVGGRAQHRMDHLDLRPARAPQRLVQHRGARRRVDAYLPSFYGTMTDAINAGDESDRLLVAWDVRGHRFPMRPTRRQRPPIRCRADARRHRRAAPQRPRSGRAGAPRHRDALIVRSTPATGSRIHARRATT
jgi:hypothetical protein